MTRSAMRAVLATLLLATLPAAHAASFGCSALISRSENVQGTLFFSPALEAPDVQTAEARFIAVIESLPGHYYYTNLHCVPN